MAEQTVTPTEQFQLLRDISIDLSRTANESDILSTLASYTGRTGGVDTLTLMYTEVDTAGQPTEIQVVALWRDGQLVTKDTHLRQRFPAHDYSLLRLILQDPRTPLFIENIDTDSHVDEASKSVMTTNQAAAMVILPLHSSGKWYGLLSAAWRTPHIFSQDERTIYESITPIIAAVVANRCAYRLQEQLRLESETRVREMEIVARVGAAAALQLEISNVLQQAVDTTHQEFGLYHTHIYVLDEEGKYLILAAGASDAGRVMQTRGYKIALATDNALAAECGRTRQNILINDTMRNDNFVPNPLLPEIRAELVVPLILGDNLLGVLDLQSSKTNRFNNRILLVMTTLAHQVSISIQNAKFYTQQVRIAEELRQLDKLKSQFLASMSHELRTPLNAILNFTEFLSLGMLGDINEAQIDACSKIFQSGSHLLDLINDVLDVAKIEAGMMQLFIETEVDLLQELTPVIATAQTLIKDKPIQFIQDIDTDLPIISCDRRRIRQVVFNLISNAAKFTVTGSITLSIKNKVDSIVFAVADTGPGISLEDQAMIFEPFKQSETGLTHGGGTGLGLPISRSLMEAHGGQLWVESENGEGAIFYARLPTKVADH